MASFDADTRQPAFPTPMVRAGKKQLEYGLMISRPGAPYIAFSDHLKR